MKLGRCWGNVAHQSDHRPVCSIEHAWSTTEEGESHQEESYIFLRLKLHLSQIEATSLLNRSFFYGSYSILIKADSLRSLVLAHVCLIWKWSGLTSGCKWIGTGSQILFVQTPASPLTNLFQLLVPCWDQNSSLGFGKEWWTDLHQNRS